jgi:signal transduction histidine kinase
MLGIDRIESGMYGFSYVEINMTDLLNNIIAEFKSNADKKRIVVTVKGAPNLPKVSVDPQKMRAVLQNLIENSLKYTQEGGKVDINLDIDKEEHMLITFEDNGAGIPKDQQKDIFKRFFRAENAKALDPEGSGLGLFIVKTIVERHGGTMRFESEEGKGTKFFFTLPLHH